MQPSLERHETYFSKEQEFSNQDISTKATKESILLQLNSYSTIKIKMNLDASFALII